MTRIPTLCALHTLFAGGCSSAPTPPANASLEFLAPQEILTLQRSPDGALIASFSQAARYFCVDRDDAAAIQVAEQQLKRAVALRDPLYVTIAPGHPMPRVVRVARTADPRAPSGREDL